MSHSYRLLAAAALCALAACAQADPLRAGRLTLDIKIDGTGTTQSGKASATVKTAETIHMAFTLLAGSPEPTNRLDLVANPPTAPQPIANVQAKNLNRDQQKAVMEKGQKALQACGQDVACMQRVAMQMTQDTSTWQPAMPAAPQGEDRYLTFAAAMPSDCKPAFSATVRDITEGTHNDVQGLVPFSQKALADYKGNNNDLPILCAGMLVLDLKTNRIWYAGNVPAPRGRATFIEGTHTVSDTPNAELALNRDAMKWALQQLNGNTRSGKARTTLKAPLSLAGGHKGENTVNVEASWYFDGK
ncbi:hypothetical protein E4L96_13190 [Massilia arenosa]|uniref:Lipoprotein n=1 Tax=Zemynaea arenosa TaxID=2561931 RepID=A0A4Y9SEI3_9BURK|nr:hypothetical protein [Massilia arenosa]TFW18378.1 hypothetical protein E4L96_13190 [Massilia arenosa]